LISTSASIRGSGGRSFNLIEVLENLPGFFLINNAQGKSDVNDNIVAHLRLWHARQVDLFDDTAEADSGAPGQGIIAGNTLDSAWNC